MFEKLAHDVEVISWIAQVVRLCVHMHIYRQKRVVRMGKRYAYGDASGSGLKDETQRFGSISAPVKAPELRRDRSGANLSRIVDFGVLRHS